MSLVLTSIYRYPVKSCRRDEVQQAMVEPWGLAGDRRWMLVDGDNVVVTAREQPRLVLVTPHFVDGGLLLTVPGRPDLLVRPPLNAEPVMVQIWKSEVAARPAPDAAHDWFSSWLGLRVRLVYLDDPTRRRPNPVFSRPDDRVSFADGYPLLLTTGDSLAALNQEIAAGPRAAEGPLPMTRFRPNVVVTGAAPWAEDGWRRLRIGDATFRAVKGCGRCVLTMIDPETAAKGKEPIATLARNRRWDAEVWFGMNLIPDSPVPAAWVRVGDPVEILEQVDSDGPPR